MNKVYVGKIVNTHGIKGELRIISELDKDIKEEVFKLNNHLIIKDKSYKINGYRKHKHYDMVMLDDYNNINQVLELVKSDVYINKEELNLSNDKILDEELITYQVLTTDNKKGLIKSIEKTGNNYKIIRILLDNKEVLIPYNDEFIKVDKNKKIVTVKLI